MKKKEIFNIAESKFNRRKPAKSRLLSFFACVLALTIIIQPIIYSQQKEEQLSAKEKLLNLLKETDVKESKEVTGIKETPGTNALKTNINPKESKINTKPVDEASKKEVSRAMVNQESQKIKSSGTVSSFNSSKVEGKSKTNEFPYQTIILLIVGLSFAIIIINKWRYNTMKIKKYKDWKTLSKIFALVVATLVPTILLMFFYVLPQVENKLYAEKGTATKKAVEIASSVLNEFGAKVTEKTLSLEEAQKQAISVIKTMRYEGKEYFWINNLEPRMIMHPYKPELNGKELSGNKDPNGKHLFVEFVNVCKEKGEGFVEYMWEKPGASEPLPKISFVKLYSEWGWIVGSGIYVD
ncbi:MAG: cache domain-containing protein, partial [Ignavibacteria bacterium]|nr:cache domain-containing protein [Ignavibacteria bacterium]